MLFANIFKPVRHRRFTFKPRYHHEEREAFELRKQVMRGAMRQEGEGMAPISFRDSQYKGRPVKEVSSSNRRLILIIFALALIAYLLIY